MPRKRVINLAPSVTTRRRRLAGQVEKLFGTMFNVKTPKQAADATVKAYGDKTIGSFFRPLFHNYRYGWEKKDVLEVLYATDDIASHLIKMDMYAYVEVFAEDGEDLPITVQRLSDFADLYLENMKKDLNLDLLNTAEPIIDSILLATMLYSVGMPMTLAGTVGGVAASELLSYATKGVLSGSSVVTYAWMGLAVGSSAPWLQFSVVNAVRAYLLLQVVGAFMGPKHVAHGAHIIGFAVGFNLMWYRKLLGI